MKEYAEEAIRINTIAACNPDKRISFGRINLKYAKRPFVLTSLKLMKRRSAFIATIKTELPMWSYYSSNILTLSDIEFGYKILKKLEYEQKYE